MKHFYVQIPEFEGPPARGDTLGLAVMETDDVDELDVPGRIYLGSEDDDGKFVADAGAAMMMQMKEMIPEETLALTAWSPFLRFTLHGCGSSVVVNRDHILMVTRTAPDDKEFAGATRIFVSHFGAIHVTQPYDEIEKLLAPADEDPANAEADDDQT